MALRLQSKNESAINVLRTRLPDALGNKTCRNYCFCRPDKAFTPHPASEHDA
ncbi:hypothetical protein CE10_4530 [Escherichia coli O7:K1 str. CE10]|nr:hypothetical protein CE10_4530 [Escherichia coli O7:K1 str. CE10]